MEITNRLLARLDAIGESLKHSGQALALLGLGSVGMETNRLDAYSDLDFFVIARAGAKQRFLRQLDWLEAVHPLVYYFLNTVDGYKAMYEDGIFCEFAVFELEELRHIPFAQGRIVWQSPDFDSALLVPPNPPTQDNPRNERPIEWLLGEAITNLYVGLGRYHRGEKLSATRFIQGYAVDRVLELSRHLEPAQAASEDKFSPERRFEVRYPVTAEHLSDFMQGYDRNIESAAAILAFLEGHFSVNPAMSQAIRRLSETK